MTLGSSASPWDSCKDYWSINWPVLRDCKCCEVWRRRVQLLPCEYRCEAGLCACSITFQHVHGLGTRQSCGTKSLWSICRQHQHRSCFADDAAIFTESLEVLVMALDALHEEVKPLGLKVSWAKTKVQVFGGVLDETVPIQSVHVCGEDIEILKSFTYLGSVVHNDGGSSQEVTRSIWRCRYLCRRTKIRILKSLVIPVLLYGCETWTLT